jgi:hypothetical protein
VRYDCYVSATATLLFASYILHNGVAWLKVESFFVPRHPRIPSFYFTRQTGSRVRRIYLSSLAASFPVWIFYTYNNFQWNVHRSALYEQVRPYEFLARDPWWVFTNGVFLHVVARSYGLTMLKLVRGSPRLGIVLLAVVLVIAFTVLDVVATILPGRYGAVGGLNPLVETVVGLQVSVGRGGAG